MTAEERVELRKILDVIDNVLARNDAMSQGLWHVLTALRGPDRDDYIIKSSTTIPIRRAAFPLTTNKDSHEGRQYVNRADFGDNSNPSRFVLPDSYSEESGHFISHVESAAFVLGLI